MPPGWALQCVRPRLGDRHVLLDGAGADADGDGADGLAVSTRSAPPPKVTSPPLIHPSPESPAPARVTWWDMVSPGFGRDDVAGPGRGPTCAAEPVCRAASASACSAWTYGVQGDLDEGAGVRRPAPASSRQGGQAR